MDNGGWEEREYLTSLGGLRVYTHPCVYEPAEDSLLAVEAVARLARLLPGAGLAADLGSGTGILGLALNKALGAYVVATDVNEYAVAASARTLGAVGTAVECRWAACMPDDSVDVAVVNPPYLPVADRLSSCPGLAAAWSGGPRAVEESCLEASRVARRALILVYSSLTGWEPWECLARQGYEPLFTLEEPFFMEKVYVVAAGRRDWTS